MRIKLLLLPMVFSFISCASVSMTGEELWEKYESTQNPNDLLQKGKRIKIRDIVFHDWAYPLKESLQALANDTGDVFLKYELDSDSRIYHGLKFRVDLAYDYEDQLHTSGPKIIGFIKYSDSLKVKMIKAQYRKKDLLTIKGYYLGVLPAEVWDEESGQVVEEDMPAFLIESISSR